MKEIVRVTNGRRQVFDLGTDPGERNDLSRDRKTSESLQSWRERVVHALENFGDDEIEPLDEESIEKLRALGYLD